MIPPRRNKASNANRPPAQPSGVVKRSAPKANTPSNLRRQLKKPQETLPDEEAALPVILLSSSEPTIPPQYSNSTLPQPKHVTGSSSRRGSMNAEDDGVREAAMILLYMGNKTIQGPRGFTTEAPCKAHALREQWEQNEKEAMEALHGLKVEKRFEEGLEEEWKNWRRHEQVAARSFE